MARAKLLIFAHFMNLCKTTALALIFLFSGLIYAQADIQHRWRFHSVQNEKGEQLLPVDTADYFLVKKDSTFQYQLKAKNNLFAAGSYAVSGDTLTFQYTTPSDTTRHYTIKTLNDTFLVLNEGRVNFRFSRPLQKTEEGGLNGLPINYDFSNNDWDFEAILRGLLGLVVLVFITFLFSNNRKAINWPLVVKGLGIQLILALCILRVSYFRMAFDALSRFFVKLLGFTQEGSEFLFGGLMDANDSFGYIFAFQVLPTVIFFSALTSLLFYYGVLQKIVFAFAWFMKRTMKLSGAESLAAAGNIFLGQTESPLLVKPYIKKMTRSELLCLMSGGMATIAGGVLFAYIGFLGGTDTAQQTFFAKHLLAASLMSAPAAVVAAKIMVPETHKVNDEMHIEKTSIGANALEALANGTTQGLKLAVNVGAMLLVFIALVALVNSFFQDILGEYLGLNTWVAGFTNGQYDGFTLEFILGYTLAPITWLMGVEGQDIFLVGQLLGEKTILNEFVAYVSLGDLMSSGKFASEKSIIIATYILCGFSNFASIGIQIGGIGSLAPSRKGDLSKLGFRALVGGTLASLFTAVIVGMLL